MPLTETQLAGLKKNRTEITDHDLRRILPALGLRKIAQEDLTRIWAMPIVDDYQATVFGKQVKSPTRASMVWTLDFYVSRKSDDRRVGPVFRIGDANVLQMRGAKVMSDMFESVDDVEPFTCPECGDVGLTWDGRAAEPPAKPGMVCGNCEYQGNTGGFKPFKPFN